MNEISVATWNINSIRARLPILVEWLKENKPDVVLLQELKAREEDVPREELEELNYNLVIKGQKSYNGVAILSKYPLSDITYNLPTMSLDNQSRYLEAWVNINNKGIRVSSIYAPNGNPINSEKFSYKLTWLNALYKHLKNIQFNNELLIMAGDYNICCTKLDAANEELIKNDAIYQKEAIEIFRKIINVGYFDAFRLLNTTKPGFTYWDYGSAFSNDIGVRIDYLLLSANAMDHCEEIFVDKEPRRKRKPSDHTPLIAKFLLK